MSVISDDETLPSYRPVFLTAVAMVLFLVCTLGGWGVYARLDSAVVTQGVVLAESKRSVCVWVWDAMLSVSQDAASSKARESV